MIDIRRATADRMPRNPRYDILFESVQIGPVRTRNRFFQVPHCNGMGHLMPAAHAAMREVKAEGGWAVVSTEECEIHPSADLTPSIEARLWDDGDIPALALMCEAVHRHGALAAIELTYNGPPRPICTRAKWRWHPRISRSSTDIRIRRAR